MLRVAIVSMALTLAASAQADSHCFQAAGTLKPNAQAFYPLTLQQGVLTLITVNGNGKSDLDCYLLVKAEEGKAWHVLGKDESDLDSCSIGGYIKTDKPLKLWVLNNGTGSDTYTVTVDQ
jgi:hypothetical protein